MANWRKLAQGAAGAAGAGEALNIEDVFSTYLYHGTQTQVGGQTITNNIDLSTEGGMVWFKARDVASSSTITDTDMGAGYYLQTTSTNGESYSSAYLTSFNTDGFTLGAFNGYTNNDNDYVSWTFRKAPKFFDVVTYTGDGTDARTVSHNLGVVPGMMIVKRTDSTGNWCVYHRSLNVNGDNAPETDYMYLNSTQAASDSDQLWDDTAPTATEFTLHGNAVVNASGATYVAYLFAHNDGDGGFGPTGDQDIIKCGSFTHSTSTGNDIDLGFEPQWLLYKASDGTTGWYLWDTLRGWGVTSQSYLRADTNSTESTGSNTAAGWPQITSTGFRLGTNSYAGDNKTFIYMAIRRGPMAVPESATDVFGIDLTQSTSSSTSWDSGFPVDMAIQREYTGAGDNGIFSRLTSTNRLRTNTTAAEQTSGFTYNTFDSMEGWGSFPYAGSTEAAWMWRRAPNFFDVVAYTGSASSGNNYAGQTLNHNLGAVPEMMWVKRRQNASSWIVYHKDLNVNGDNAPETDYIVLNSNGAAADFYGYWDDTAPTDTTFTLGSSSEVNNGNETYIAYLFASLDGISKVGSYTRTTGTTIDIDLGFNPRFFMTKGATQTGSWHVFDTERGIVAGSDPALFLESTSAQLTGYDLIDPITNGIRIIDSSLRDTGQTYIYYAIA